MTPTAIVLASVALGIVTGALATAAILAGRIAGKRRAEALRPVLSDTAVEVLQAIDDYAVVLDASLSVVYANPAARATEHITDEELRDPAFLARARAVMTTGVPDIQLPDPESSSASIRVHLFRLQNRFLVVLAIDLGEEQRVNAMRRDFIANVSHELKTPIAAISLLSEAVLEGADDPQIVTGFARSLIKESRRLSTLSRDIIQLSEAQSVLRPEDREPISLRALVAAEVEAHRSFASQHQVQVIVTDRDEGGTDPITLGKPASLGTVLANLLSNAIRHSPEGGRVGVGFESDDRVCTVTVTDQGEGIPPEHLPRIFERFYRVDPARSRAGGGTGLGLSIARHTMRAHGGDISVWSQPGVGSSFTLTFPLVDERSGSARSRTAKSKKRKKKRKSATPPSRQAEHTRLTGAPAAAERTPS